MPELDKDKMLSSDVLIKTFKSFANLRKPRTAALVKGARAQGESRVIDGGLESCLTRDERLRKGWTDEKSVEGKYDALFREPY